MQNLSYEENKKAEEDVENNHSIIVRNYKNNNDNHFYHIYTSSQDMKDPIMITITSTNIPTFKEYLKDDQKDELNSVSISKSLVLLPIYSQELKHNQFYLSNTFLPLFQNQFDCHSEIKELGTYDCEISEIGSPPQDLEDLMYYLAWQFSLSELEGLTVQEGESQNIMKIITKEIYENYLYDCYSNNNSIVILNSGITLKFTRKTLWSLLRRVLLKWRDIEDSVYHSDQLVTVCQKILSIMGSSDSDYSYSLDEIEDSELYESLQRNKKQHIHSDKYWLHIGLKLASKKDRTKVQSYKMITSMDEIIKHDNIIVEFVSSKDLKGKPDISIESGLFNCLYYEDVVKVVHKHYW